MKTRKAKTLAVGTISEGTTDPATIADSLIYALRYIALDTKNRAKVQALDKELSAASDGDCVVTPEFASELLDELTNIAQNYAPDYCTVGNHPGDGADFGVWPDHDALQADGYGRDATIAPDREAATPEQTHAYEVNDHGNATLWRRAGRGRWVECWAVV